MRWGLRKASSPHRTRPSPLLPLRHPRTACRWTLEAAVFTLQGARGKWRRRRGSLTPPQPPTLSTHKWVSPHELWAYGEVGGCLDSCPFKSGPFGSRGCFDRPFYTCLRTSNSVDRDVDVLTYRPMSILLLMLYWRFLYTQGSFYWSCKRKCIILADITVWRISTEQYKVETWWIQSKKRNGC